ncbi:MAG: hypothetical protein CM15mP12_9110 [Gammaproteobacteria bacterium]|nr:MAG: hypothetical protein CM15mP12_9110 [Gammaproteobacteria bacterium]
MIFGIGVIAPILEIISQPLSTFFLNSAVILQLNLITPPHKR